MRHNIVEMQKIAIFTGKGGVGKSTLALAYAKHSARSGQRVLLLEFGNFSYFSHLYGLSESFQPQNIKPNLDIAIWRGESCLKEYIQFLVKIPQVANLFFENKLMKTLVNVAPGLKELALTGKLTSQIRNWGPNIPYDLIVLDCYATGHFLSLIRAPKAMSQIIEFGPMGDHSREIDKCLRSSQVQYFVVSTCEQLPVVESLELMQALQQEFGQKATLILNKFIEVSEELDREIAGHQSENYSLKHLSALIKKQNVIEKIKQEGLVYKVSPFVFIGSGDLVTNELSEQVPW